MPILNYRFTGTHPQTGKPVLPSSALGAVGPRVPVMVTLHPAAAKYIEVSGGTPPEAISGMGLIDTGATLTAIDRAVAEKLGLSPTGTRKLATASGAADLPTYAFSVAIHQAILFNCELGVACDLQGQRILILIGMDILSKAVLVLNGPEGLVSLAF